MGEPVTHDEFNPTEYERRHAALDVRLTKLETMVANLVTRDDLYALKNDLSGFRTDVASFRATIQQAQTIADAMATKTDVVWLKGFFWKGIGMVVSILLLVAGALIAHMVQAKP